MDLVLKFKTFTLFANKNVFNSYILVISEYCSFVKSNIFLLNVENESLDLSVLSLVLELSLLTVDNLSVVKDSL